MNILHKDAPIFYSDQGAGRAIVLLHGFLENRTMWEHLLPFLTKDHRVICIDLPGHGASGNLGYVHTMEDMARAVLAVVTHLDLHNITIIGHSMGGYVGCAFAKMSVEKPIALCLLNSTPEPDDEERKKLRSRANTMAKKHYEQLLRMSFVNLFETQTREQFDREIKEALSQALKTPVQGYIAANSGMKARPSSISFWKESPVYKGMILGANDWIINAAIHKSSYEMVSNYFEIIDGGHMTHITNKLATQKAILKFLTSSKI